MDKAKLGIVLGLVALLAAGVGLFNPKTVVEKVDLSELFVKVEQTVKKLGAVVGPDTYFPYVANNDLEVYTTKVSGVSSTTPCVIRVPLYNEASTTLTYAGMLFRSAPTSTVEAKIWTGLDQQATTTQLAGASVASTATGTLVSATTSLTTDDVVMAASDRYIVFSIEGKSPYIDVGQPLVCIAEFKRIR